MDHVTTDDDLERDRIETTKSGRGALIAIGIAALLAFAASP